MKASLSEIFAALYGLDAAGVTLCLQGARVGDHPITKLAVQSSFKSYDAKVLLLTDPKGPSPETRDKVATRLLGFLDNAAKVMAEYPDTVLSDAKGGKGQTLTELRCHILDMVEREKTPEDRMIEELLMGGIVVKEFNALYLPGNRTTKERSPSENVKWQRAYPAPEATVS